MKYKDLPTYHLTEKLMATSFDSPSTNRKVFDWCNAINTPISFLENERIKLINKYGEKSGNNVSVKPENAKKFYEEFSKILDSEVEDRIPVLPLSESDFRDDRCGYPRDKELWMTGKDISDLLSIKEKQGI